MSGQDRPRLQVWRPRGVRAWWWEIVSGPRDGDVVCLNVGTATSWAEALAVGIATLELEYARENA